MTTTTVPDVDLEAWAAGETERPCELPVGIGRSEQPCPNAADWLLVLAPGCEHGRQREHYFICGVHHSLFGGVGVVCWDCEKPAEITFTERIR